MPSPDVVIDLGCYPHQGIDSIGELADKYRPSLLLGFDPLSRADTFQRGDTLVITLPHAAWTWFGKVGFHEDGIASAISDTGSRIVDCFDLAHLVAAFKTDTLVVKMDVEGAEYPLLDHLHAQQADERVSTLLVEWHGDDEHRDRLLGDLRCPVEEWLL